MYVVEVCRGGMSWRYVVDVCRGRMSWRYIVDACRGGMSWRYVVKACRGGMSWRYVVECHLGVILVNFVPAGSSIFATIASAAFAIASNSVIFLSWIRDITSR